MATRKIELLSQIIDLYIKTAEPVSSSLLVQKYKLNRSSATIRNEMAALEKEGLIFQPHTSAGRIPTEKGYCLYVQNLKLEKEVDADFQLVAGKEENIEYSILNIKGIAKDVAEKTNALVFLSFGRNDNYYTGLSNLFSQPEFAEQKEVCSISATIDELDKVLSILGEQELDNDKPQVLIGAQNPFSPSCTSIIIKYNYKSLSGVFGIIGPMRMDYSRNIVLIKKVSEVLKD